MLEKKNISDNLKQLKRNVESYLVSIADCEEYCNLRDVGSARQRAG
jgi:hypothetical protein